MECGLAWELSLHAAVTELIYLNPRMPHARCYPLQAGRSMQRHKQEAAGRWGVLLNGSSAWPCEFRQHTMLTTCTRTCICTPRRALTWHWCKGTARRGRRSMRCIRGSGSNDKSRSVLRTLHRKSGVCTRSPMHGRMGMETGDRCLQRMASARLCMCGDTRPAGLRR
jgi:hypothetical protein